MACCLLKVVIDEKSIHNYFSIIISIFANARIFLPAQYVEMYKDPGHKRNETHGVPAAITLAQGILKQKAVTVHWLKIK